MRHATLRLLPAEIPLPLAMMLATFVGCLVAAAGFALSRQRAEATALGRAIALAAPAWAADEKAPPAQAAIDVDPDKLQTQRPRIDADARTGYPG